MGGMFNNCFVENGKAEKCEEINAIWLSDKSNLSLNSFCSVKIEVCVCLLLFMNW